MGSRNQKNMAVDYEQYFTKEKLESARNPKIDDRIIAMINKKGADTILDVGASIGILAEKLVAMDKHVTCVDIKTEYIAELKRKGLNTFKAEIENLPFNDKEFDLAIAEEVLEHLENPGAGLKELCRVANSVIFTLPIVKLCSNHPCYITFLNLLALNYLN